MELVVGDAATIKLMLDYIYTSSYDATNFSEGALTCHLKLIEVADFYVILGLKEMAWAKIQAVAQGVQTLPVQEFITALRFVYDTLNHEEKIKKHMIAWAIQDSEHLLNNPTFEEVLSDFSQLGKELTLKMLPGANMVSRLEKMRLLKCLNCDGEYALARLPITFWCPYCQGSDQRLVH